ncbi:hypothetical protein qu_608 [Acanthamoeba polyphaga mimivirus]|nr:hypothetical protein [Mimivirus reunion]WMV61942.1 hypothetical protein qu_608 [Mimivirus sp.]WMV62919.1 hypothetical protein qu_608 [Acanthamoeba polyphaga mimivirus]WMV63896.1 hypothetical protein qu_608 [Mimivirus sp.]
MDPSILSKIHYSGITCNNYGFYNTPFYLKRDKEDNVECYQTNIFMYYDDHDDHNMTDCDYTYCFVKDLCVSICRGSDDNDENHSLLKAKIIISDSLKLTGIKNDTDGSIEFPQIDNENPLILREDNSTTIKINLFGQLSDLINYQIQVKFSAGVIDKSTADYFNNNEFVCFDDFTFSRGTYLENSDSTESEFYREAILIKGRKFDFYPYQGHHVFDIEYDFLDHNFNPIQPSNNLLEKLYFVKDHNKSKISSICSYTETNPLLVDKYYDDNYIDGLFEIMRKKEMVLYVKFMVKKIDSD